MVCNCSTAPAHHQGGRDAGFGFRECNNQGLLELVSANVHISELTCKCRIASVISRISDISSHASDVRHHISYYKYLFAAVDLSCVISDVS